MGPTACVGLFLRMFGDLTWSLTLGQQLADPRVAQGQGAAQHGSGAKCDDKHGPVTRTVLALGASPGMPGREFLH